MKKKSSLYTLKMRKGPDGIHFFDRATGTNVLINETIPPSKIWTHSPRQVSIALTNACDLSCSHCYAPKKTAVLSKEQVNRWMKELDETGTFGIGFGGGEPTLHPNLAEICEYGQQNTSLAISMTTHGHRLTAELVEKLEPNLNFLRISMDGVNDTYEQIRGVSFTALLKKFELIKGRIPFGINYVINKKTINDLSSAMRVAEQVGASELLILPEEGIGQGTQVDDQTLMYLKSWIDSYQGDVRLSISSAHKTLIDTQIPLEQETEHLAFAHIDAAGILKNTSFDNSGLAIDQNSVIDVFKKLVNLREGALT